MSEEPQIPLAEQGRRHYETHGFVKKRVRPCEVVFTPNATEQSELDSMTDTGERMTRFRAMKAAHMQQR